MSKDGCGLVVGALSLDCTLRIEWVMIRVRINPNFSSPILVCIVIPPRHMEAGSIMEEEESAQWSFEDMWPEHWQQSKLNHCWKWRDLRRSVIRVYEPRMHFPALKMKRTNVHENTDASQAASFMGHKENSSKHKSSQEAAHQPLAPQGPFPPQSDTAWGILLLPSLFPLPSRKMMFPGRVPNDRDPFSFTLAHLLWHELKCALSSKATARLLFSSKRSASAV